MAARRSGFTLVELLVVMSIIAALMGLLLPAVQSARETARRSQCLTRVQQFSLATQQFDGARGYYPGYLNPVGGKSVSFVVCLLPYMEHNDLYTGWADTANTSTTSLGPYAPYLEIAKCPSDPTTTTDNRPISYVGNSGIADPAAPSGTFTTQQMNNLLAASGIFQDRITNTPAIKVKSDYVSANDGLSNTLMYSENMLPTATWYDGATALTASRARILNTFVWWHATPATSSQINGDKKNTPTADPGDLKYSRPASQHPGGVNTAFCDGRTKFIAEEISYGVYKQLLSPNGRLASSMLGGDSGNDTPLDENQY